MLAGPRISRCWTDWVQIWGTSTSDTSGRVQKIGKILSQYSRLWVAAGAARSLKKWSRAHNVAWVGLSNFYAPGGGWLAGLGQPSPLRACGSALGHFPNWNCPKYLDTTRKYNKKSDPDPKIRLENPKSISKILKSWKIQYPTFNFSNFPQWCFRVLECLGHVEHVFRDERSLENQNL